MAAETLAWHKQEYWIFSVQQKIISQTKKWIVGRKSEKTINKSCWRLNMEITFCRLFNFSFYFFCKLNQPKKLDFRESRAAVEKLIRRCCTVDISSDHRQDVCINTQMLNGWRMSEWKVAAAAAKIHSFGRETQVHIPASATRYEHMVKWTWHQSRWTDVNPGQIITSVSERTFFHLISVF